MVLSALVRFHQVQNYAAASAGFITSDELKGLGVPIPTMTRWCRAGMLIRMHRGVYRTISGGFGFDEAVQLGAKLMTQDQAIGGRSALALWSLPGGAKGKVNIVGPKGTRSESPHVVTTEYRDLRAVDITQLSGVRVTTPLRTVIDTAKVSKAEVIGAQLTDSVRRGLFTYDEIGQRLAEVSRRGKHGVPKLRAVLAARTDSGRQLNSYESTAQKLFSSLGFPAPKAQFHVVCGRRNYYVDVAWPDYRLFVECDSMLAHSTPEQLQADLRRQNDLLGLGWALLRFTYWDIVDRPSYVADMLGQRLPSAA